MTTLFSPLAMLPDGWARNVRIVLSDAGRIESVAVDVQQASADLVLDGRALLPAAANLHSHTFQRAMAGLTGLHSAGRDDFWSWRTLMYKFLDVLTPDEIEAIAALAFMEMLEAGFASVGEFHYVHHQPGGEAYDDPAELSARIFAAASKTGIGLTHLPVLYVYGGARQAPLTGGQLRFGCDMDRFADLVGHAQTGLGHLTGDAQMGVAPHSLRAISPDLLTPVAGLLPDGPVHIHAAEQTAEVEDICEWLSARPIEYLLDKAPLNERWCIIHATHMTDVETDRLATCGAVAGLCPITEADLGDGIFSGDRHRRASGRFGIGTDSNVRIALAGELRQLEYSQRLAHRSRNILSEPDTHVGEGLYRAALRGGAQALGRDSGRIAPGAWADLIALDLNDPVLVALPPENLLDGWIFSGQDGLVTDVWSAGRHMVRDGHHVDRERIAAHYCTILKKVMDRL